jgi:phosphoribosylformylglycinamidine synthase
LIEDISTSVPSHFQSEGDAILVIGSTDERELGGSAYLAQVHGLERGALPALDYALESKTCQGVATLASRGLLKSCHDLSQGGLGVALAECCFREYDKPLGAKLSVLQSFGRPDAFLFAETGARFIVSCSAAKVGELKALCAELGLSISAEGRVGGRAITVEGAAELDAAAAFEAWFGGLAELFEA